MATIPSELAAMIAELELAWNDISERHFAADEKRRDILRHFAPLDVRVYSVDGFLARFYEEGIEFYPEEVK